MTWKVEFDITVEKDFSKLNTTARKKIINYLEKRIATPSDPRRFGKALKGSYKGLWRNRVDDYRIICRIEDSKMTVLVIKAGHRKKVYQ